MTEAASTRRTVDRLFDDLRGIFGPRLQSLILYGRHAVTPAAGVDEEVATGAPEQGIHTLVLVESFSFDDLSRCARSGADWIRRGLAVPLILTRDEFVRSLDAFPLEYGAIIAGHVVVAGENPFNGVQVSPADLRRACEVQTKSHLLHLRESYIEASGQPSLVVRIIAASAPPFRGLLYNLARLQGGDVGGAPDLVARAESAGLSAVVIRRVLGLDKDEAISAAEAMKLFPEYLVTVERLARVLDTWTA